MIKFLLDTTLPAWVTTTIPIIRYVFLGIILACAIFIIVSVTISTNNSSQEGNVITGGMTDSYYRQNKASNTSGRMEKFTTISIITIGVLIVLYFLSFLIFAGV